MLFAVLLDPARKDECLEGPDLDKILDLDQIKALLF